VTAELPLEGVALPISLSLWSRYSVTDHGDRIRSGNMSTPALELCKAPSCA
jgi:hypothetical protein